MDRHVPGRWRPGEKRVHAMRTGSIATNPHECGRSEYVAMAALSSLGDENLAELKAPRALAGDVAPPDTATLSDQARDALAVLAIILMHSLLSPRPAGTSGGY